MVMQGSINPEVSSEFKALLDAWHASEEAELDAGTETLAVCSKCGVDWIVDGVPARCRRCGMVTYSVITEKKA